MAFNNCGRHIIFTAISLWVSILWTPFLAQAQDILCRVKLHQSATASGPMIQLKDVADVWAQDEQLNDKLAHLTIARAPAAGQTRWVMKEQVVRQLKAIGLQPQQWQLSSEGPTKVMPKTVTLPANKIRDAVEQYVKINAPWQPDQMKIQAIKFKRDLQLPEGKVALDVRTPKHSDWLGAVLYHVDVQVDGRLIQRITVPVNIEVWSDIILAAKPLGKYQPITNQGIKIVRMNLARVPANAIVDAEQVIGQRTKRNIAINSVLRRDQIEMPPLVKRGDRVQAIASSPVLKISVQAVVKESGGKGEMVRVLNLRSKKIIHAQVVDAQTVSVPF